MNHSINQPLQVLLTTPNLDTAGMKYVIADLIKGFDRDLTNPSLCVHRICEYLHLRIF